MKINIISVGKLEKEFAIIYKKYVERIKFFAIVNEISVNEFNDSNIAIQKSKETKKILNVIPKNSKVFLCSLKGKEFTSPKFSKLITSESNLTFIIGGSHGVNEEDFHNKIKVSNMTFPHQMFKVMLIEQIYRAITIKNNMKYHK